MANQTMAAFENTRNVVSRHVHYRTRRVTQRYGSRTKTNGHSHRGTSLNGHSLNDFPEDEIDGFLPPVSDLVHRNFTSSLSSAPANQNGHSNHGEDTDGIGGEQSHEFDWSLRTLTEEFEKRYEEAFRCSCNDIFLTPSNAHAVYMTAVYSLFSDGTINWGRVVALLAFSGAVAAECIDKEMPNLVEQVIQWTSTYIDQHLASWIQTNGGWNGLVKFHGSYSPSSDTTSWPTFKTLCGCAVGAIGVLTLGALLTQK